MDVDRNTDYKPNNFLGDSPFSYFEKKNPKHFNEGRSEIFDMNEFSKIENPNNPNQCLSTNIKRSHNYTENSCRLVSNNKICTKLEFENEGRFFQNHLLTNISGTGATIAENLAERPSFKLSTGPEANGPFPGEAHVCGDGAQ